LRERERAAARADDDGTFDWHLQTELTGFIKFRKRTENENSPPLAVRKKLDLVWVWFYKEVAPTALPSKLKFLQKKNWLILSLIAVSLIAICSICVALFFIIAAPYSVTGQQGFRYSSHQVGELTVIQGWPQENGKPTLHNWLYVMIVCPEVQASDSQFSSSGINHDIMSNPEFHYDWGTQGGIVHVAFRWNLWSDTISIGKLKFVRKDGNVFVVVRSLTGDLKTQQCGSLGSMADLPEIVQHIRQHLPNDNLVASIKFYDVNN
jgi:hypothetical protein